MKEFPPSNISLIDTKSYIEFVKRSYPTRKNVNHNTHVKWRIKENPFYSYFSKNLIVEEGDRVIGQIIPIFSVLIEQGVQHNCVWGSDYFVDSKYRDSRAGIIVLKCMIRDYLHFGVGMSEVSLKMHKIFGEEQVANRFDFFFISGSKRRGQFEIIDYDDFLEIFDTKIIETYKLSNVSFFVRTTDFYKWMFQRANKNNIKVVIDSHTMEFVMFYKDLFCGIPYYKIVDYSPHFVEDPNRLMSFVNFYGSKSVKKLFYFSGSTELSGISVFFRKRRFPVFSNLNKQIGARKEGVKFHITGLDSDRFINSFL